ncbi:MAG: YggS family pyridoxal phosphate-dependent enzyme [Gammaproteobacteria bacterium]|nr:YggS family pyridoxal phosphate-dependent enzyme [Gammaproteobacteria bacterium]PCH62315.1 MAG: YggS family pyridoxal phosphate-dependent enzyme [Gammaproteobacteria bacterium]PCH64769.1 MAG: YggS family pyridoxal phosphate-dependent enzyme [Gammaproteobacteria bacterium]
MPTLNIRYTEINQRINDACKHYERNPDNICLLAVSKGQHYSAIKQLYALGQRQFGESYLNETLEKQSQLAKLNIEWHYIGRIQSNKTADIAQHFAWVHSVDRLKIANRLNDQRDNDAPALNICLQVNINQENSKGGVNESDAVALAKEITQLPNLRLRGLMALPQRESDISKQREHFACLRHLRDEINAHGLQLDTLSMGMSNDFTAAIAEHSTHLRIGSALFGPRQT